MSLRDRKKARVREALGASAALLFRERGYARTTIEEIAQAAGVSRRTYFRYFSSKEEAFFADHQARMEAFCADASAAVATVGAWRAVTDGMLVLADHYQLEREAMLDWHRTLLAAPELVSFNLKLDARWEAEVRSIFLSAGADAFDAAVRAGALFGTTRAALATWFLSEGRQDLRTLGRRAFAGLSDGFAR